MFGVAGSSYEDVIENDTDEVMLLRAAMNAMIHLKVGVTTLRENGARNKVTFNLREGAQRGYVTTPRLLLCGRPVTVTGGHFYWCNQQADGVEGVRAAVRELVKDGADHIKIMASGGGTAITDLRRPSYTVEELPRHRRRGPQHGQAHHRPLPRHRQHRKRSGRWCGHD